MAINYVTGDIMDAKTEAIVNTVNCVGVMGKGLALQVKEQYPKVFNVYKKACDAGEVKPGKMHIVPVDNAPFQMVINFPTKRHWRDGSRIRDIEAGMQALVQQIRGLQIDSIAIPKLGCANGGLDWEQVRAVIVDALKQVPDVDVHIYGEAEASKVATTLANKHYMKPEPNDEYIGRGSKWGNPFSHKDGTKAQFKVSTREEAVAKYREWILRQPELLMSLHELKGKRLVCFCTPHACHGDVLIDLIENTFYLVIAGGRDFKDYALLKETADKKLSKVKRKIVIVSGRARGADSLGEKYAKERGYDVAEFPVTSADWDKYGKSAGHRRNREMAKMPKTIRGGLLAFWDGDSRGTGGMIDHCESIGVQTKVAYY